jgi:protein PhnA
MALLEDQLRERSNNTCELCGSPNNLSTHATSPEEGANLNSSVFVCDKCLRQLERKEELDATHWGCLKESMWSEVPAVQVVSWRLLNRLKNESWAADLIDMMYLDDDTLEWAKSSGDHIDKVGDDMHRDCNGAMLQSGDSITLIKTLEVKGSQISAKIGTVVKNIKLVSNNTEHIEGKIEGQQIVILTKFVRKSS